MNILSIMRNGPVIPVIVMALAFAWKYRASNKEATYTPEWAHSTKIELVVWGIPLLIIIALGYVTYVSTHHLDPYRPLDSEHKPVTIQVVAMDWKWLFIYPEQGIATVNKIVFPANTPINFRITSDSVMNSFFIPALAGQIYAMPGMETKLHAVINQPGVFDGFSANYSGEGFSGMRFKFHGVSDEEFARWVQGNKAGGNALTRAEVIQLEQPSAKEPIRRFASVEPGLWSAIVDRCVDGKKMCASQMMAIDAQGGMGKPGAHNTASKPWQPDNNKSPMRTYVAAMCTPRD